MLTEKLYTAFMEANQLSVKKFHKNLTVEHLYITILQEKFVKNCLILLRIDYDKLIKTYMEYIDQNTPQLHPTQTQDGSPTATVMFGSLTANIMEYLNKHGYDQADIEDVLAMFMQDQSLYGTYLLRSEGIESFVVTNKTKQDKTDKDNDSDQTKTKDKDDKSKQTKTKKKKSAIQLYCDELVGSSKTTDSVLVGRKTEIDKTVLTLNRKTKNNPILVGEPGVGKSAIVYEIAKQIANKTIANSLKRFKIYSLSTSSLIAGTKYRGEFEQRLKKLLKELKKQKNSILFIDEIHNIVGAGAVGDSSVDMSDMLKPLLTNGDIKCIGITTYDEYRNIFDADKALSRRFSKIDIDQPDEKQCIAILEGIKHGYEKHHDVKFASKTMEHIVQLSNRYLYDRSFPDVAIDVLDETATACKLNKITNITTKEVKQTVCRIANIPNNDEDITEKESLINIKTNLQKRIFGQDSAIDKIAKALYISSAGLKDPDKPIASFLFTGPTGVGKTELAKQLAKNLNINFARFDMSEYQQAHTASTLIGSPAGYVGYEKGGQLTNTIKKNPYTVLLLDEIEKAHKDLVSILLQVMDRAKLSDNNGDTINFENVILIMTSNLGQKEGAVMGFEKDDTINESKAVKEFFSAEFRNRLDSIVPFSHIDREDIGRIVYKFIDDIQENLKEKNITIDISKKAKEQIIALGYDKQMGARPLQRVISKHIKEPLSYKLLFGEIKDGAHVKIGYINKKFEVLS